MRDQLEGSRAVAMALARCRPNVIPAYPITPQTHIVEALGVMARTGELPDCEFITVESEFAAMSAAIGAAMAGARAYTATASQGLLYMSEALFNASGLQAPIVLTVANRAIGAPINIWNDHSDAMSQRDCGWVQLYAADNQAAVDLHILAFRLAEAIATPVMVCMDGFVLTHAFEAIDVPDEAAVMDFVGTRGPAQLDPADPVAIGAMVGPDAFTEVRYLADHALRSAESRFEELAVELATHTGRRLHALDWHGPTQARTVVVGLGSVAGVLQDVVDASEGDLAALTLTMFRPFPSAQLAQALAQAEHVVVVERAFSPGAGGIVSAELRAALSPGAHLSTVVAGLGGRAVTAASLGALLARPGELAALSFLDLRTDVIAAELARRDGLVSA